MRKSFYALFVVALVAVGSAFTAATSPSEAGEARAVVRFQFEGDNLQEAMIPENWRQLEEHEDPAPGCGSGNLPCYVETSQPIDAWLSNQSESTVANAANAKKQ